MTRAMDKSARQSVFVCVHAYVCLYVCVLTLNLLTTGGVEWKEIEIRLADKGDREDGLSEKKRTREREREKLRTRNIHIHTTSINRGVQT